MYFPSSLCNLCALQVAFFMVACLDIDFHCDAFLQCLVIFGYLLMFKNGAVQR